jgi:NADPH:quinone reductase-like Zn-dependent oxidoreductase
MKAIVCSAYGSADVLRLEEIAKPVPKDHEVLIRVGAASVNPIDWHFMRGSPRLLRLGMGLKKPKVRLGADVAGTVETVGANVTQLKVGDTVFGTCRGSLAEYACTPAAAVTRMPGNATFEQAATLGVAALTALQALRDKGKIQPGHEVLINGASGGVGTFAVQIAKWSGAAVTAVCSTRNLDLVRSLGADRAIDYTRQDFAKGGQQYDMVFDLVWNHSLAECRQILKPKGRYVIAGISTDQTAGDLVIRLMLAMVPSARSSRKFPMFIAKSSQTDLVLFRELVETGKLKPVIDRSYPLNQSADAIRYLEQGHARGKVTITVR